MRAYGGLGTMCLHTTKTLARVLGHKALENANPLLAQPDGIQHVVVQDRLKQIVFVVCLEWRLPRHHLIHQHTECPPVNARAVLELLQDFWSNVIGCSAESGSRNSIQNSLLDKKPRLRRYIELIGGMRLVTLHIPKSASLQ